MLKMAMTVVRLPALTHAEFDRYWREVHGPLVIRHAEALRIRRYVQTPMFEDVAAQTALQAGRGTLPNDFDGLGELWWNDLDDYRAIRASPEGLAAAAEIQADERRFVDLARSHLWFGTEQPMIG